MNLEWLLRQGVSDQVFPSAQAVVIHDGREVFSAAVGDATPATRFDLASLTKILATTPLFMKLWSSGQLGPAAEIRRYAPNMAAGREGATLGTACPTIGLLSTLRAWNMASYIWPGCTCICHWSARNYQLSFELTPVSNSTVTSREVSTS